MSESKLASQLTEMSARLVKVDAMAAPWRTMKVTDFLKLTATLRDQLDDCAKFAVTQHEADATERARLEGEVARLREALEAVITHAETTITNWPANYPYDPDDLAEAVDAAKEALRHDR